ncbi:hypothetical protein TIFTF001_017933 [Ficus carica]|uniref:Uncharacterized protein n=1 Tax=Ficus carica TaxID=3494 RepID=A0AA88ARF6_FICCA|nr:hypothetical protein TIFTF001_017933 [Ficus carica]
MFTKITGNTLNRGSRDAWRCRPLLGWNEGLYLSLEAYASRKKCFLVTEAIPQLDIQVIRATIWDFFKIKIKHFKALHDNGSTILDSDNWATIAKQHVLLILSPVFFA